MNDIFSFSRFGLLLKKFTKEHIATYLLYIAVLFGILILIYGITILSSLNGKFPAQGPIIFFDLGIVLMGSLFASSFYNFFHNKAKGIQYLNLPSSRTEKILVGFMYTQVIFFIVYFLVFYLVDHAMVALFNHFHHIPGGVPPEYYRLYVAKPMEFSNGEVINGIAIAFVVTAISHYGSLSFEKNAFVKTALLTIIIGAALVFYGFYGMLAMIPETVMPGGDHFFYEYLRVGTQEDIKGIVFLPASWNVFFTWFLPLSLYVLFWTSSYFKLKEKQV